MLDALRHLSAQPELSQRKLSERLGLSLGKTHYVVRALLDEGLVKVENFKRSDHKLAYAYLLTPKGMKRKLVLTRAFLARKQSEFELARATMQQLEREMQTAPHSRTAR
jgi:EPS-associated MarR family transcriptional regulator